MKKVKLTDICNPKQWKTIPTGELLSDGYPVYGANGLIGYYNEYNHEDSVVTITCRGATCGSINITVPKAYITGNAMCLDNLSDEINRDYLYYNLFYYVYQKLGIILTYICTNMYDVLDTTLKHTPSRIDVFLFFFFATP